MSDVIRWIASVIRGLEYQLIDGWYDLDHNNGKAHQLAVTPHVYPPISLCSRNTDWLQTWGPTVYALVRFGSETAVTVSSESIIRAVVDVS